MSDHGYVIEVLRDRRNRLREELTLKQRAVRENELTEAIEVLQNA